MKQTNHGLIHEGEGEGEGDDNDDDNDAAAAPFAVFVVTLFWK
jgi:hypothetical protein